METVLIYDRSHPQHHGYLKFTFDFDDDVLPFPLNLNMFWRCLISAFLAAIFVLGVRFRLKIISFIRDPETKLNETNILFCLDQVNGLFVAIMLVCSISFTMITVPVAEVVDPSVCNVYATGRALYISGTIIWRCCIAIYRAMYLKAQMWLTEKFGTKKLLYLMIVVGLALMAGFSSVSVSSDRYSYSKRMCNHWSKEALDVYNSYQVPSRIK